MCEHGLCRCAADEPTESDNEMRQPENMSRALENEKTLNLLLRAVVQDKPLPEIALSCLDRLLSVSWLSILPKGGFFLTSPEGDELELIAQRNLSPELLTLCARVPFGRCLCGKAAASGKLLYSSCVNENHEITFQGMAPHGHYNVPIVADGRVLGVLVFYLPHGHQSEASEVRFLEACADILSLVVRQKLLERDLNKAMDELRQLAQIDALTELYNRRFLLERLEMEVARAERSGGPLSVLVIDADFFKNVNDTYGHETGDAVLVEIARQMNAAIRNYDIVGRLGGEEFCVILPGTDTNRAREIAERIRSQIEMCEVPGIKGEKVRFTVSIGLAERGVHEATRSLLARADTALYRAKQCGRNQVKAAEN